MRFLASECSAKLGSHSKNQRTLGVFARGGCEGRREEAFWLFFQARVENYRLFYPTGILGGLDLLEGETGEDGG